MAISAIMGAISTAGVALTGVGMMSIASIGLTGLFGHFIISTAMGAALNALTPKPSFGQSRGFSIQGESGSALDHQVIYGEVRVGGARIYDASTGTNNEYLHRILAFAGHEINSYQKIWINDAYVSDLENTGTDSNGYVIYNVKEVTDPDGTTSERYDGFIQIKQYLGTANQPADANLITDTTSLTDGEWTTDHKLSGIAYLYVRFKYSSDAFPNGVPAVSSTIRGKKVYDPRTATTAWSDNPALCLRDYLTSDYGMSQPSARINDTLVSTAANICEQSVESEDRYTCNGAFVTSLTPTQIISDLLTSMGGLLWYAQGQWRMKAAAYTSPVADFDEDDLRSQISVSTRHSRRDGFNKVKGTFRGAETDWQPTDYPAVAYIVDAGSFVTGQPYTITEVGTTDFTLIGASSNTVGVTFTATGAGSGTGKADYFLGLDNGISNVLDYALPFTASSKTAQRIARIALNRNREQLTVSASFGLRAFAVQVGDIVRLTNTRFGWTNKEFEVLSWTFGLTEGLDIQVQMTLRETSSGVFTGVNGEAFSLNNTTLPNPFDLTAPTGLIISDGGFTSGDGTFVNSLIISWTPPANAFVSYYELDWKRTSDSVYNSVDVSGTQYQASPVQDTVNYAIRVRAVSTLGVRSPYASTTYTAGGDVTAPADPTSLSATGILGFIELTWVNPADKDLNYVEIWESANSTLGAATEIAKAFGTTFNRGNLAPLTQRYYWIRAVDFSDNKSGFVGPVNATTRQIEAADIGPAVIEYDNFASDVTTLFGDLQADIDSRVLQSDYNITVDLQQQLEDATTQLSTDALTLALNASSLESRINDAGITVDPDTGAVTIQGLSAVEDRVNTVEIDLDAVEAQLTLTATTTYVNNAIAAATLPEASLAALEGLEARVDVVEIDLNAVETAITLTSTSSLYNVNDSVLGVEALEGRITIAEDEIELKASQTALDDVESRLSSAEITLNTLDAPTITLAVSDVRRINEKQDDLADLTLQEVIGRYNDRKYVTQDVAYARQEFTADVNDQREAFASLTTELQAQIDVNQASILSEQLVRASADSALASDITQLQATVVDLDSDIIVNASAISSLDTRVTNAEGTISSQATAITTLQSDLSTVDGEVTANASAISGLNTRVTDNEGFISAQASQINSLSTTVGNNTTTITQAAQSIDGIEGRYGVTIDNNGSITGYQLLSGVGGSAFNVRADQFAVFNSTGAGGDNPFTIFTTSRTIDGVVYPAGTYIEDAYIDSAAIVNGSITTAKINNAAITTAKIDDAAITTAKIGNLQVDTLKIANQAVSNTGAASGGVTGLVTTGWTVLAQVSISTSSGSVLVVHGNSTTVSGGGGPGGTAGQGNIRIRVGDTVLQTIGPLGDDVVSLLATETSAAGTTTAFIEGRKTSGDGTFSASGRIVITELKK